MNKNGFKLLWLVLLLLTPLSAIGGEVEVSDIATKVIEKDNYGDVSFAIKAKVTNNTKDSEVFVFLQAIDSEGFEIYEIALEGKIAPGTSRVLTESSYMSLNKFNQIDKWQLDHADTQ